VRCVSYVNNTTNLNPQDQDLTSLRCVQAKKDN